MKYIRTKDGIVKHPHPYAQVFTFRYEIVKQANTIEELCDEFICHRELVRDIAVAKSYSKAFNEPVYACIYIEGKGFIIVAKMNEKGELELL